MSLNNSTNGSLPYPPEGVVFNWWLQMVIVAVFNIVFFIGTFIYTGRRFSIDFKAHPWEWRYAMYMRYLSIPFVFQTTWRSFLPTQYGARRTFIDNPTSSILLARSLAFVGEICWGIQIGWALSMIAKTVPLRGSETTKQRLRKGIPIVGIIIASFAILGNIFSTVGVVTTNYVYPTIEETFWGLIFFLGGVCSILLWHFAIDSWTFSWGSNCFGYDINPFDDPNKEFHHDSSSVWVMRMFIRGYTIFAIVGTPYMFIVDVPKYAGIYFEDQANGKVYFDTVEGFQDAATRRIPIQTYEAWDQEFVWQSFYFSFGTWASIALMHAPGHLEAHNCNCAEQSGGPVSHYSQV